MSFQDDQDGQRRRKPEADDQEMDARPRARRRRLPSTDVGDALKSAYQRTISEDIPPEMLDLLGKLG